MNGAEYIIEFLNRVGVKVVFGYPGGSVLTLYHALKGARFTHVLTGHEQGAAHAAEGYARVTGETGVIFATSGPGATNIITGIADAFLDSTPIFAITGQVSSGYIGRDSFQEADVQGITIPITKYNRLIKDVAALPDALNLAWETACSGRPGPVLLDITKDVFAAIVPQELIRWHEQKPPVCESGQMPSEVLDMLRGSERPLILAGGGVIAEQEACDTLLAIAEQWKLPVATTMMGKGAIPETHENCLGFAGMHGQAAANMAMTRCDLLIAVGTRFSDRVIGSPEKYGQNHKIIHVDIDSAELNKNVIADLGVCMDAACFLKQLKSGFSGDFSPWLAHCTAFKQAHPTETGGEGALPPQYILRAVSEKIGENTPVVTDVGQHQMFAAQHVQTQKPRRFITSGGLGTMGFGLPAAAGAAMAQGIDNVVLFVGDGGVQMTIQELGTIRKNNLPVKIFIMDNGCLGMVRQWQELFYEQYYSQSILCDNPKFTVIAQGYGIKGLEIFTKEDFDKNIDDILNEQGPVLIHCHVEQAENVFPMVPPGGNPVDMMNKSGSKIMNDRS